MLRLDHGTWLAMLAHAYDELPYEMCGLLAGPAGSGDVQCFYPCRNAARSARVYTVDPRDHLRADRDAEERGWEILGVVHSHTHTPAHPSPTDVDQSPDPAWHYAIVSLADGAPALRSWRISAGNIDEEAVVVAEWLDSTSE
ncbi:MAG: peptidase [Acidimicrobiia bacterium]|nr:peptidase [Acidimicrobiia bacterium]